MRAYAAANRKNIHRSRLFEGVSLPDWGIRSETIDPMIEATINPIPHITTPSANVNWFVSGRAVFWRVRGFSRGTVAYLRA
jgi:hypothetical protein